MKKLTSIFSSLNAGAVGLALSLLSGAATLQAQDAPPPPDTSAPPPGNFGPPPGNFDPAQMRQRMMERMREQLAVTDDAEWKAISERVGKVMDARRAAGGLSGPGGGMGFFGPGGPPGMRERPAGAPGEGGPRPGQFRQPGGPGGPGGFNREPSPELDALRKALQAQAPAAEIKAKLADLRAARVKKEAELAAAQEELRQVLSVRQEAVAVTLGLLK